MRDFFYVYGAMLGRAILVHLGYVAASVAVGFFLGLALGILLSRLPRRWSSVLLPVLSVFQTIPGIVFIGLLFLQLGQRISTVLIVLIALSVYATFPVLKNTYTGLCQVEERYKEAARGCGMSPAQTFFRVELPLAMPTIIGGLRLVHHLHRQLGGAGGHARPGRPGQLHLPGRATPTIILLIIAGAVPAAVLAVVLGARGRPAAKARDAPGGAKGGAHMSWTLIWEHLYIVLLSVLLSLALGLPLGMAGLSQPRAPGAPSCGSPTCSRPCPPWPCWASSWSFWGRARPRWSCGITLYSLLPIVRNTCLGLQEVDPGPQGGRPGLRHEPPGAAFSGGACPWRCPWSLPASASPWSTPSAPPSLPPS
jgi:osmoprotectant transport system permease protein